MDLIGLLKSQFLCHLVFCYVFIASGLIINAIQLVTLLLRPVNKQLFRKINCRLSYCVSSLGLYFALTGGGKLRRQYVWTLGFFLALLALLAFTRLLLTHPALLYR